MLLIDKTAWDGSSSAAIFPIPRTSLWDATKEKASSKAGSYFITYFIETLLSYIKYYHPKQHTFETRPTH